MIERNTQSKYIHVVHHYPDNLDYGNDGYGDYKDLHIPDFPDTVSKNPNCGCPKSTDQRTTTPCIHTTGEISTAELTRDPGTSTPLSTQITTRISTASTVPIETSPVMPSKTTLPDSSSDSSDSR